MAEPVKIDPSEFTPLESGKPVKIDPSTFSVGSGGAAPPAAGAAPKPSPPVYHEVPQVEGVPGSPVIPGGTSEAVLRHVLPATVQTVATALTGGGTLGLMGLGAGFSVAGDYWNHFVDHLFGEPSAPRTLKREALMAAGGAAVGALPKVLGEGAGLGEAERYVGSAQRELSEQQADVRAAMGGRRQAVGEDLDFAQQQENTRAEEAAGRLRQRQADIREDVQKRQQDLAQKQADVRQDLQKSHAQTVRDLQAKAEDARARLREAHRQSIANAEPGVSQKVATARAERMVGKTPAQLKAEQAEPYEARASARSQAQGAYFDGAGKFHREVGDKFKPYVDKIQNEPVPSDTMNKLRASVDQVEQTVGERGQRIGSADLNRVIGNFKPSEEQAAIDPRSWDDLGRIQKVLQEHGWSERQLHDATHEQQLAAARPYLDKNTTTWGELWGWRSRANAVLAESRDPADRWAANEIVGELNKAFPNIPPEIRQQYAFERTLMQPIGRDVAGAASREEVGKAIFDKTDPAAPLAVIRFTQKYNPEGMPALRDSFADYYLGKGNKVQDLGKLNPAIIRELYGKDADDVLSLLGPDGQVKTRSAADLIAETPAARRDFQREWDGDWNTFVNQQRRQALRDANQALEYVPPRQRELLRRELAKARTPEEKLRVLQDELPPPAELYPSRREAATLSETVTPTREEARTLAAQPAAPKPIQPSPAQLRRLEPTREEGRKLLKTPHEAAQEGLRKFGGRTIGIERYAMHRYLFDLAAGGATFVSRYFVGHPYLTGGTAGVLLSRAGVRYALSTPGGARLFLNLMESKDAATMAKGMVAIMSHLSTQTLGNMLDGSRQLPEPAGATPPATAAAPTPAPTPTATPAPTPSAAPTPSSLDDARKALGL